MTSMTTAPDEDFLTIREVSEKIRRHRVTVSRMIRDGELRAVRGKGRNGRVFIYADSVAEYLKRNEVEPPAGTN
ncbi:MAG: helix-turn-helix domain-containing protein [Pseudonocardia sp.]